MNLRRNWQNRRADWRAVREVVARNHEYGWSAQVLGEDRDLAGLQAAAERVAARSRWGRKADAQLAAEHLARQRAVQQELRRQTAELHARREQAVRDREAARRPIFKVGAVRGEPGRTVVEGWAFGRHPGDPEGETQIPDGPLDTRDLGWSVAELRQISREAREHQALQAADPGLEAEPGA